MKETFTAMLAVGGKLNSLGMVNDVVGLVLQDNKRLDELYSCLFHEDAWVRMRAADALEKVCREHPDWLLPYIDNIETELASSNQPSIQWHIAQIYAQVELSNHQKVVAIDWLANVLTNKEVDWIVSANAMTTLVQFTKEGFFSKSKMVSLLKIQQNHKSNAVKSVLTSSW